MPLPPNAISAVSTARQRSEAMTASTPRSRRRAPSAAAWTRPVAESLPPCQPVAMPRSLSSLVACVSKTISTPIARRGSPAAASGPGRDGAALDRRERRRPRAERRDLAVCPVQAPVAERMLGLHQLVHLRRALVDDRRARIAEVALDPVLRGVAVRAVHLDREVRRAERRLGRMPLRERGLARVPKSFVLHPRRLHHEQLRRLVAEHHLGDHVLDELV